MKEKDQKMLDILSIGDVTTDVFVQVDELKLLCKHNKKDCLLCMKFANLHMKTKNWLRNAKHDVMNIIHAIWKLQRMQFKYKICLSL